MKIIKHISVLVLLLALGKSMAQQTLESQQDSKLNEGVYIVAEVSDSQMQLKDSLTVTYKLYVSYDISISDFKLLKALENKNFEVEDIEQSNISVQHELFENEKYRFVVLKKSILKPKVKGKFELKALTLEFTAQTPTNNNDEFGRPIMNKVNRTIKTDDIIINVI